jgi:lysozyme family protein
MHRWGAQDGGVRVSDLRVGAAMAAGWYADPSMPGNGRWYDGTAWTNHVYVEAPVPSTQPETAKQVWRATTIAVRLMVGSLGAVFAIGGLLGLLNHSPSSDATAAGVVLAIGVVLLIFAAGLGVRPRSDRRR